MISPFLNALYKNKFASITATVIFVVITAWFLYIHSFDLSTTLRIRQIWGSAYQIMALFGGLVGLTVSGKWGGYKSLLGRAIMFFSIGLLLQTFGQSVNSYYNFFKDATIPYPSFGDVGFMGSVFAYIYGAYLLMKATGFKFSIKSVKGKAVAIGLPLIVLVTCYFIFLQGYQFDWTNQAKVLLDFGYPFGQAIYISIALLAYLMSRNYFGGLLRQPVVFLILALILQYISDFTFLYQANASTWYVGGLNDFLYFV
ncbi:MAG: hypothetical protein WCK56_15740, partial [Alcaligenaceae bacterium]